MSNPLDNLSAKERELAIKILKEYSENGYSSEYNKLLLQDYRETPVDIETFITDKKYLGVAWTNSSGKSNLYPFWLEQLKKLFPDPYTTSVNTFIESGARGLGKSEIAAGIIAPYLMHRVMCLKNPLDYFGLKPTEKIVFGFMNIKLDLAEEIAVDKFQKTIQMSKWFTNQGNIKQRNNKPYWVPPEPISIIIGSQSDDLVGLPVYFCFFDEISFIKNMDVEKQKARAIDMIDTALGGMKTRFIKNGKNPTLLVLASSKRSDKSFLEVHIKQKLESEPDNVIIVDKPVWEVKPKGTYSNNTFRVGIGNKFLESIVLNDDEDELIYITRGYQILNVPVDFKSNFLDDIERALCDYAGISSSELSKYIAGAAVTPNIVETRINPFSREVLEIGNGPDDKVQYYEFFDIEKIPIELRSRPLYIHLDMSISGDMTGIAGTFIKGKKVSTDNNQAKDLFYSLGFSVSIKAPKGRQVSFEKNRNFIRWLKQQGFNIKEITCDTYQSYDLLQQLSAEGFNCSILSVDRVDTDRICKPYQAFRSALYENRFELFLCKRLFEEITDLERNVNTGKVDHPPNGHKDMCDAVCGSMFTASKHAEEFAFECGEDLATTVEVSLANLNNEREQFVIDFEEELKKSFSSLDDLRKESSNDSFMNFGMGKAQVLNPMYLMNGIVL